MSDAPRNYDVILYGATGYTGRLVAEYLNANYGVGRDLKWAIAGRSEAKLKEIRDLIGAPASLPLIVADSDNPASLAAMVGAAKVIISTVGPYQLYGSNVVAACAQAGTDYVDLTGESHWIAQMMAANDATAKKTGARLVFSCGFDSIPFDGGVFFVQQAAKQKHGAPAPRVRGRVRSIVGGASGGTMASGIATMAAAQKDPSIIAVLTDPFALTPGFKGPAQPNDQQAYEDTAVGSWVIPFMMAAINTKAVHRTNFLLGHPYGKDFQYDEMQMVKDRAAPAPAFNMAVPLKPGEGPTKEERENGSYDILFVAEYPDGRSVRAAVKGDKDPGYGSTSKILAESAICLAATPRTTAPGGCWSPLAAMGEPLIKRLHDRAGLTFHLEG